MVWFDDRIDDHRAPAAITATGVLRPLRQPWHGLTTVETALSPHAKDAQRIHHNTLEPPSAMKQTGWDAAFRRACPSQPSERSGRASSVPPGPVGGHAARDCRPCESGSAEADP
eukprot:CAMPEP_0172172590 /NCGR_PEP_ID=MMETSP1050-20130122/12534_1 /TAXON_ID=233186 /ORGANISM="Cryptomonas curvata, Strain CCAP979/52" /LENGTH=113 /DNA_ID=CAMNT_0012844153 /DNA_START=1447 /DNA_END=1788 /DNA_ORIENTATION=+